MPPAPALIGTYPPPAVRKGDRVTCLLRDGDAVVISWTAAPVPWPRCRAVGSRGGSGLLMTDDLRRAVQTESAAALRHWFGASRSAVNYWRRWAGVAGHATTPGTRMAHHAASAKGAEAARAKVWTAGERAARSAAAKAAGRTVDRWGETAWSEAEDALLGTDRDKAVASRLGRFRRPCGPAGTGSASPRAAARDRSPR